MDGQHHLPALQGRGGDHGAPPVRVPPLGGLQRLRALHAAGRQGANLEALRQRPGQGIALTGTVPVEQNLQQLWLQLRAAKLPPAPVPCDGPPVTAWTDGSAVLVADPLLCRAGWGLVLEQAEGNTLELQGGVPGPQSAQRAEVLGALQALLHATGPLELVTDSSYVCRRCRPTAARRVRQALAACRPLATHGWRGARLPHAMPLD